MVRIRQLTEHDVPAVVALFEQVYPAQRWPSREECSGYFREIFFANPWRELDLPSWVAEERGALVGFAGVLPRRMLFESRPLRVAIGCQFMVHPDARHSLVALQLIRKMLAGTQDLFVTDGSNEQARRVWLGIGGTVPILQNLDWTRLLRPTGYALSLLDRTGARRPLLAAARTACALADGVAARVHPNRFAQADDGLQEETLEADGMLDSLPEVVERSHPLRSLYDLASLRWLLAQAVRKIRHGRLRARAVLERGRLLGWFIYYARAGSVNEVLQLAAREGGFERVLQRLFRDAWRQGATALRGRLDPPHLQQLSDRHCWLRREGAWTLIHSRHADVVGAIERGAAGLGRLDGEWWLRFIGG
ncbi:MAG TPA: GNAT family N-acetyltransferase [Steroidobacteraceae bacterium]|nr:GNAT family N-acetyltransferase [Steroidobacteraceae bacterium]